uniref:Amidohydrolase family protein n=1 Tax=Roseihalotalea indica TaxID=2867963 RepID=A0AA49GT68_9BACT|nr:amidohydrolase family protein [Tunicatimonas sp. TK19036]
MKKIDAHQHFWRYHPDTHAWITDEMSVLRQDYLPADLASHLEKNECLGSVAVQATQTVEETEWLLKLADQHKFILGVVGWVDLRDFQVKHYLQKLSQHPKLKGIRHVIQDEPDDQFMLDPAFLRGVKMLPQFNLTYDLLIYERHLPVALPFVSYLPDVSIVVDHIAKPKISQQEISPWRENIQSLAQNKNVCCKLSGMVTEADWHHWTYDHLTPYLDIVIEAFGADRLMIGSDWPVCRLAAEYEEVMEIIERYFSSFSEEEKAAIFYRNAARFYQIDVGTE